MTKPCSNRFRLAVAALLVLCSGAAIAQSGRTTSQALVPAQFNRNIQDAMGFHWDLNQQGAIQAGTNRCFSSAGQLLVNGSGFSPSQQMMTPDGMEYVLTRTQSGVQITRRVRIDVKSATLRYVESFHNPQTTPVTLDVKIMTSLRSSVSSVITNTGRLVPRTSSSSPPMPSSARIRSLGNVGASVLGEKDCGLLVTRSSTSYPAVLIYLAGPRSKLRPMLQRQSSYRFLFTYPVTVPPKKTVSIVHGLAQRNIRGTPSPNALANYFKPFQSRDWTRNLPLAVRRSILNAGRPAYGEEAPRSPLLQPVMNLADQWDVERGKADVLAQDEQTRVSGAVRGSSLTVETPFGKTTVPLGEVALLLGGGGIGRTQRVHLRNGEILVGTVGADEITLEAESGLEVELAPKQINLLFMHADPADGKPPPKAVALLKTHHGDQLALAADSPSKIRAATAWGPIEVPLDEIDYLYPIREPQPIHRLILNNKTRLSVILGGSELELATLRFGPVKLAPGAIARLASVKAAGQSEQAGEDGEPQQLKVPHCRLLGGNLLVGDVAAARLELLTPAGLTPVDARLLRLVERQDEDQQGANPAFSFELANGTSLVGRFRDGVFPLRALGKVWKLPAHHVLAFRRPEQTAEEAGPGENKKAAPSAKPKRGPAEKPPAPPPNPPADDPFRDRP